jgi:hypothetical protein
MAIRSNDEQYLILHVLPLMKELSDYLKAQDRVDARRDRVRKDSDTEWSELTLEATERLHRLATYLWLHGTTSRAARLDRFIKAARDWPHEHDVEQYRRATVGDPYTSVTLPMDSRHEPGSYCSICGVSADQLEDAA